MTSPLLRVPLKHFLLGESSEQAGSTSTPPRALPCRSLKKFQSTLKIGSILSRMVRAIIIISNSKCLIEYRYSPRPPIPYTLYMYYTSFTGKPSAESSFTAETTVEIVLNNDREGETVTYRVFAEKEQERERKGTNGKRLDPSEVVLTTADKQKVNGFSLKM